MLTSLLRVFLAAGFACAAQAQWEGIGNMSAVAMRGNQITFRNRKAIAEVTVLAPDLVRVHAARGKQFGLDTSTAIKKTDWPVIPLRITKKKSIIHVYTTTLEIRIQCKPFDVAFHELNGRLISHDAQPIAFNGSRVRAWKELPKGERYYGLGERAGPLELNGRSYVMWNTDPSGYDALTEPMYISIPSFIALQDAKAYGMFFNNTHRTSFDFGVESPDMYSFGAEGGELNYYFFWGPNPKKILERYTELTGRAELPPQWSVGYIQSSMHYAPENKVREIAAMLRARGIPCDVIFLDNKHLDKNRIWTWDRVKFPDPKRMIADLRALGFHIVAITDPGVFAQKGYLPFDQGIVGGHFLRKKNGELYTGLIWPGLSAFPDFSAERTRSWWGLLMRDFIADGIAGFLTDMNEPTANLARDGDGWMPGPLDPDIVFSDEGRNSPYAKLHNVYGKLMAQATKDGLLRFRPNERPFVITRATNAGGQKDAAQWTGDVLATWEGLRASLRAMLSMGLSGLPFVGSNAGGFIGTPTPELYARWLQLGIFSPFFWTHSASQDPLEPWSFGTFWEDVNRRTIELRYRLLPYLYNALYQATQTGLPVMRALLLEFPDDETAMHPQPDRRNYEFMFGGDLLVAPAVREGERKRTVYLPKGIWIDFWTEERYAGPILLTGKTAVDAPTDRIPIFVRGGAIIPMRNAVQHVGEKLDPLVFEIYPDGDSSRDYYEDDGLSFDYKKGGLLLKSIDVFEVTNGLHIEFSAQEGSYTPSPRALVLKIHGQESMQKNIALGATTVELLSSVADLEKTATGAAYDAKTRILWLKVPDQHERLTIDIRK